MEMKKDIKKMNKWGNVYSIVLFALMPVLCIQAGTVTVLPGSATTDISREEFYMNRADKEMHSAAADSCHQLRDEILQSILQKNRQFFAEIIDLPAWFVMIKNGYNPLEMRQYVEKQMINSTLFSEEELIILVNNAVERVEDDSERIMEHLVDACQYASDEPIEVIVDKYSMKQTQADLAKNMRSLAVELQEVLLLKTVEYVTASICAIPVGMYVGGAVTFVTQNPVVGVAAGVAAEYVTEELIVMAINTMWDPSVPLARQYVDDMKTEIDDILLGDLDGRPGLYQTMRTAQLACLDSLMLHAEPLAYQVQEEQNSLFDVTFDFWK